MTRMVQAAPELAAGEALTNDYLQRRPKGTVIRVTDPSGSHFWLEAEGASWRDFILHQGTPPKDLEGRASQVGRYRRFWSTGLLAHWVAEGLCRIELDTPTSKESAK